MHHGRAQTQTVHARRHRATATLLAYHLDVEQDAGAYTSLGVYVPEATLRMTTGVYTIPRRGTARARMSATTPVSAYRGSGRPEATVAIERAIDVFAREIDDGPGRAASPQFRRPATRSRTPTPVGTVYDTGDYEARARRARDRVRVRDAARRAAERRRTRRSVSSSGSACRCTWSRPPPAPGWSSAPSPCGRTVAADEPPLVTVATGASRTVRATTPRRDDRRATCSGCRWTTSTSSTATPTASRRVWARTRRVRCSSRAPPSTGVRRGWSNGRASSRPTCSRSRSTTSSSTASGAAST